jgi:hypothetical protein
MGFRHDGIAIPMCVRVRGYQYPLRIGICLHCICSVSAIHFHQMCTLAAAVHLAIDRS